MFARKAIFTGAPALLAFIICLFFARTARAPLVESISGISNSDTVTNLMLSTTGTTTAASNFYVLGSLYGSLNMRSFYGSASYSGLYQGYMSAVAANPFLYLMDLTTGEDDYYVQADSGRFMVANVTDSTTNFYVHNNRIGVNTNSPGASLDVFGDVIISSNLTVLGNINGTGISGGGGLLRVYSNSVSAGTITTTATLSVSSNLTLIGTVDL